MKHPWLMYTIELFYRNTSIDSVWAKPLSSNRIKISCSCRTTFDRDRYDIAHWPRQERPEFFRQLSIFIAFVKLVMITGLVCIETGIW